MKQQRKKLRSTKNMPKIEDIINNNRVDNGVKTGECYFIITPIASTGKTLSDQTGWFPVTSIKGNKYGMIIYDYESNIILGEAIKSRKGDVILRAFTKMHTDLKGKGLKPKMDCIDNQCPENSKQYMKDQNITYQLVHPHIHRQNTAEKAISIFKDHLIAGLIGVSPKIPIHLLCRLLPQALLTLNLLRQSRINLKLSAYVQLNGQHDYNAHPGAPPGI